jgi:hypothetical protein
MDPIIILKATDYSRSFIGVFANKKAFKYWYTVGRINEEKKEITYCLTCLN